MGHYSLNKYLSHINIVDELMSVKYSIIYSNQIRIYMIMRCSRMENLNDRKCDIHLHHVRLSLLIVLSRLFL